MVSGANGAGKTNLLEALYFGCTGRSCRTTNEREVVRFGAGAARVVVRAMGEDGPHELSVGFEPGQPKRMRADGASVERLLDVSQRPLVSVFLPDRLELVKGPPSLSRAHLDQLVAALWPARAGTRRAYAQSLAQRNALISRVRAGQGRARRWRPGMRSSPRMDSRSCRSRPGDRRDRGVVRAAGHRPRPDRRPRAPLPAALSRRRTRPSSSPSWLSASTQISSAASPVTDPTATISLSLGPRAPRLWLPGPAAARAAGFAVSRARGDRRQPRCHARDAAR